MADQINIPTQMKKSASLIPELFYDLISRVPPGIVFIIGVMWILKIGVYDLSQIKEMEGIEAGFFLIFIIIAGYLIGLSTENVKLKSYRNA